MNGAGWQQLAALATHAARRAGSWRGALAALGCALLAAIVALGLPVADASDRPLIAAGAALAGAAAAAGIAAAVWRGRWPDHVCMAGALLGVSVPVFFLGICLRAVFTGMPVRMVTPDWRATCASSSLILPMPPAGSATRP